MAMDLLAETTIAIKSYTGPDREGTTRTRISNNGHYLHPSARQPTARVWQYPSGTGTDGAGGDDHYIQGNAYGPFTGITAELKWSELEPEDGIYDFTAMKGVLDVCAEHRVYAYLNLELKHFSTKLYTNVVPDWAVTAATGAVSFSYTSGKFATLAPAAGTVVRDATSGAKAYILGYTEAATPVNTGKCYLDVISGTFGNGHNLVRDSDSAVLCAISTAVATLYGAQTGINNSDGAFTKVWEMYCRHRVHRLLDAMVQRFGHHPWFGGFELPETSGVATADGGKVAVRSQDIFHAHTYKWIQPTATNPAGLAIVTNDGNTFREETHASYGYTRSYGRLLREVALKHPHVVCIGSSNSIPGPGAIVTATNFILNPDGVKIPYDRPNLIMGPVDVFYQNPGRDGLANSVYPQYRRYYDRTDPQNPIETVNGLEPDGTARTQIKSAEMPYYRHKVAMQFDSKELGLMGLNGLDKTWEWTRDYLNLSMVQWNYEKGPNDTGRHFDFGDMKAAIAADPNPTPAAVYVPPVTTKKTITTTAKLATFTGTTATYFPPDDTSANSVKSAFTLLIGFKAGALTVQQNIFESGTVIVYLHTTGEMRASIAGTVIQTGLTYASGNQGIAILKFEGRGQATTTGDPLASNLRGLNPESIPNGWMLWCTKQGSNTLGFKRTAASGRSNILGPTFTLWGGSTIASGDDPAYAGARVVWRCMSGNDNSGAKYRKEMTSGLNMSTTVG